MEFNWFTRTVTRVVLASYVTQVFAPVVYACEVLTLSPVDPFVRHGMGEDLMTSESESIERRTLKSKSLLSLLEPQPVKISPSLKTEGTASLSPLEPYRHLPTLSIQLDHLPQGTKGSGYRLSIERANHNEPGVILTNYQWQKDFFFSALKVPGALSSPRNHVVRFPLMGSLNLNLSESGQLTAFSTIDSSGSYQGYNYRFQTVGDLHLANLMTDGQINVKQAQVVSAEGEVYGQEGIFLKGTKEIRTRSKDPQHPTHLNSEKRITFQSPYLDNENSCIQAPTIKGILGRSGQRGASLDNTNGVIEATDLLSLTLATEVFNEGGALNASTGKARISTFKSLLNKKGFIGGKRELDLMVKGRLQNPGGRLGSERTTTVNAQRWSNSDGAQVWGRNLTGKSQALNTDDTSRLGAQDFLDLETRVLHQESPLLANKIQVQTIQALDLATALATSTLSLSTEEGPIIYNLNGLRAHKLLSLTSKNTLMLLSVPLKSPGAFEATALEILNKTTVAIKEQMTLNGTSTDVPYPVRNEGDLISAKKGLTVKGQGFSHTKEGHLQVAGDAVFPSQNLRLHGSTHIGGSTHLKFLKEQKGDPELTHNIDFSKTTVDGLLHLTLGQDEQKLTIPIAIPGQLEIDREGNSPEPLHLLTNLIAKKGLKVRIPEATLIIGAEEESQPMVKLEASEGFMDIQSKSLDLVKAQIFSRTGMRWEVQEKQIQIGRGIVENTQQTFNYKWNHRETSRDPPNNRWGAPTCIRRLFGTLDSQHNINFSNIGMWRTGSFNFSVLAPFKRPNGTFVITEGPFTTISPEGIFVDEAEVEVKGGDWDITTQTPVYNEGGKLYVQGDIHIHDANGKRIPSAFLKNLLFTQTSPVINAWGTSFGTITHPLTNGGRITINGDLKVSRLENIGSFAYIAGEARDVEVIEHDGSPTLSDRAGYHTYDAVYAIFNRSIQEKFPSEVSPAKGFINLNLKNPTFEGVFQSPLIVIGFEGKAMVGRMANYQRQATPPFQQMKMFMDVQRPTALFYPVMNSSKPWVNQPSVPLSWNVDLPPAVGLGPQGLYLLDPSEKLLLHPLQEVGDLPSVFAAQLRRGYLDEDHPDALATYIMGRHQAYALYQKFFAPKALEGVSQDRTPADNPERALRTLDTTLAHAMTEEEISQLKFMMLYYGMPYEGKTVHLPVSWLSKHYDDPRVRNPDGGVFAKIVLFKGKTPDSVLHCVSNIHGEKLLGIDVPLTILERQSHQYITYHTNTTTKKGSWWQDDKVTSQTVAIYHNTAQPNTGNMTTGKNGKAAIRGGLKMLNGSAIDVGTGGLAVALKEFEATPSDDMSVACNSSSAGGTSITHYHQTHNPKPALITSTGGMKAAIEDMDVKALQVIAHQGDISLQVKNNANLLAHQVEQSSGPIVSKQGKAVITQEIITPIALPCSFLALNGNVLLTVGGKLYGVAPHILGKVIDLNAKETDITSLLMANKLNMTSKTEGMFSTQTGSSSQETPSMLRAIFEGDEIHIRGEKGKLEGALIKGKTLFDHTIEGLILDPLIRMFHYSQQSLSETPFSSSDVGCKGGFESMVPTVLMVEKVVRQLDNDAQMTFNSVEWDKNRTEIVGKFAETTYQLKQWHTEWAKHEQLISDEALVVVALAVSAVTYGMGTGAFLASSCGLKLGTTGILMANAGAATLFSSAASSFGRTGDLFATAKEVFSPQNLKAIGISIASAGICSELGNVLKIETNPGLKAAMDSKYQPGILDFAKANALNTAVTVPLNIAIGGEKAEEAILRGMKMGAINTIGQYAAHQIGNAYRGKTPEPSDKSMVGPQAPENKTHGETTSPQKIDYMTHKGLHGVVGGISGWAGNPTTKGFTSGVIGAVVSEVVMDARREIATEKALSIIHKAEKEGQPLDKGEFQKQLQEIMWPELALGKISGASVAALLKQDPSVAFQTGTNAVENNAIMMAIGVGLAAWEVYDIIKTAQNEGPLAALERVAVDGVIILATAGGGTIAVALADMTAFRAQWVWAVYISQNPAFAQVAQKVFAPFVAAASKGKEIVYKAKDIFNKADEAFERGIAKVWQKAKDVPSNLKSAKPVRQNNSESIRELTDESKELFGILGENLFSATAESTGQWIVKGTRAARINQIDPVSAETLLKLRQDLAKFVSEGDRLNHPNPMVRNFAQNLKNHLEAADVIMPPKPTKFITQGQMRRTAAIQKTLDNLKGIKVEKKDYYYGKDIVSYEGRDTFVGQLPMKDRRHYAPLTANTNRLSPENQALYLAHDNIPGLLPTDFSKLGRQYIIDMNTRAGIPLGETQTNMLAIAMRSQRFEKLGSAQQITHAKEYRKVKDNIIAQWEHHTRQTWPTTLKLIDGKFQPERHQIHHIIPQELGGPHVWWNAHPLQSGAPHQGGVHGKESPLNQILKDFK